ncbi:MAG: hypothetical protein ACP5LW_00840 [Nitrososphaeria archaeon]
MFRSLFSLIVEVYKNDAEMAIASQEAGADAVLAQVLLQKQSYVIGSVSDELENIKQIARSVSIKKGLMLGDVRSINREEWDMIKDLDVDFLVAFPSNAPIFLLNSKKPLMVVVQQGLPLEYYRVLGHLPSVEGFIYNPSVQSRFDSAFNLVDMAVLELLASNLTKPVFFRAQSELKEDELKHVIKRGASGIIIDPYAYGIIETEDVKELVRSYRRIISETEFRIWS